MDQSQTAKVAFTPPDRIRAVIRYFNDDGCDSLVPEYADGRSPTFTLPERREVKEGRAGSAFGSRRCATSPGPAPTTGHAKTRTR